MLSRFVSYRPQKPGCDGRRRPPLSRASGSSGIESSIDKAASRESKPHKGLRVID
jgi:hypothetical protein